MAVTGMAFAAFLAFHMAGNLKVYLGAEDFDHYADWLRTLLNPLVPGEVFLWIFRVVLGLSFVAHVGSGAILWYRARKARGPHARKILVNRISARTMIWTGLILGSFVTFHVLELTVGMRPMASDAFVQGSAYANLVHSFSRPAVAFFYGLTMALLAFHLSHGLLSVVNDLGATGRRFRAVWFAIAGIVAVLIVLGNLSIPIAVQTGILT